MRKRSTLRVALVLTLAGACVLLIAHQRMRGRTLESWTHIVTREGFRLRYKAETATHYFALFQTHDDRLAVCYKPLISCGAKVRSHTVDIRGANGQDLMDRNGRYDVLSRLGWYGPLPWTYADGSVIPLIDYTGKVRLTFSSRVYGSPVSSQQPIVMELGGDKPVLEVELDWPGPT